MNIDTESFATIEASIDSAGLHMTWNDRVGKYVLYLGTQTRIYLTPAVAQQLLGNVQAGLIRRGDAVDFQRIASAAVEELKTTARELKSSGEAAEGSAHLVDTSARLMNTITELGYVTEAVKSE